MKLAIVVGHNSVAQGAVRQDTGQSEYHWNSRLARLLEAYAPSYGIELKTFFRTPSGSYTREINAVYDEVDIFDPWASLELHFNSASSEQATGTETLTSGTALSMLLAQSVNDEMVRELGLRDRGIKTRSSGRGSASLISGKAPAILIEPFFGSSTKGQQATDEDHEMEGLAHAILLGAFNAFEKYPRRDLTESRTIAATTQQRTAQTTAAAATTGATISTMATAAQEQIAQIPAVGPIADYLPWITVGLIVVAFVATAVQRAKTNQIEAARIDDHANRVT